MTEQTVLQLTEVELTELVISAVEAFQYGNGPYLEIEQCGLARKLGYNEGKIARLWRNAAEQAQNDLATMRGKLASVGARFDALRPKIEEAKAKSSGTGAVVVRYRRIASSDHVVGSFILPAPQPAAEAAPKSTSVAVPKPKPEEEPEAPPEEPVEEPAEGKIVATTQIALPITSSAAKAVATINQKHHVIGNYSNKCVVLAWELWEINRAVMIPTFQRFEDFTHRYMNRYVWVQTKNGVDKVAAGTFWLKHPGRVTYDSVSFRPKEPGVLPGNRLNLWRGFGVVERKGSWKLMHDHIYRVLGAGDPKAGLYIIRCSPMQSNIPT